jgi:mannose-6-phosphate isomerase-like protein (cupin superfamily)
MEDVKIFRSRDIESRSHPADGENAGWIKRIIYPPHIITKGTFMGIGEVNPGYSPHRWHTHTSDKAEGYEVVYPNDFEEFYYIVSGNGVVQWKAEDGKIKEEKVSAGDAIFFPVGVAEHQLFNNGTEKIVMVFGGSPKPKVTFTR